MVVEKNWIASPVAYHMSNQRNACVYAMRIIPASVSTVHWHFIVINLRKHEYVVLAGEQG